MASPSWDSSWSQSSPVSVFSSATCCFRVCKSHPTRIMSQPSVGVTSWYSPRLRLPATSGCSHDISRRYTMRRGRTHPMTLRLPGFILIAVLVISGVTANPPDVAPQGTANAKPTDGYTVHVLAPHVVKGEVMGPFHHY